MRQKGGIVLPKEPQLYRSNNLSKGWGTAGDDDYAVYLFNLFFHGYNTKMRIG